MNQTSLQIPNQRRDSINSLNAELTSYQNRLKTAIKTYSKKFTKVNQIPSFSERTIIANCKDNSNLNTGFALSDIPKLFKQTSPRKLLIFFDRF